MRIMRAAAPGAGASGRAVPRVGQRELHERAEVATRSCRCRSARSPAREPHAVHPAAAPDHARGWRRSAGSRRPCPAASRRAPRRSPGDEHVAGGDRQVARRLGPRRLLHEVRRSRRRRPAPFLGAGDAVLVAPRRRGTSSKAMTAAAWRSSKHRIIRRTTSLCGVHADDRVAERDDERAGCRRTAARTAPRGRGRASAAAACRSTARPPARTRAPPSSSSLPVSRSVWISSLFEVEVVLDGRLPGPGDEQERAACRRGSAPRPRTARPACGRRAASPSAATWWPAAAGCRGRRRGRRRCRCPWRLEILQRRQRWGIIARAKAEGCR